MIWAAEAMIDVDLVFMQNGGYLRADADRRQLPSVT
jgi:hypothetical protein